MQVKDMRHQFLSHRAGGLKQLAAALLALLAGQGAMAADSPAGVDNPTAEEWRENREICLNDNWKFHLGDTTAAQPDFDDSAWRTLDLPHDWSIEGRPQRNTPSGNDGGYYPAGIGWYRKTFRIPDAATDRLTTIYFEGVYMNAEVFINGHSLGVRPYGYSSFYHDLTPYLRQGENVIAVRVDNSAQKNCRWYTGSGIYRNVKLIRTPQVHFEPWGVAVRTTTRDGQTVVEVEASVTNSSGKDIQVGLGGEIEGEASAAAAPVAIEAGETRTLRLSLPLKNARLWSPDTPELYRLTCHLTADGQTADTTGQTFGIRTVEYDSRHGLRLNGHPIELNGACVHHDNGPLGAAAYKDAEWRKVRQLKEAGFNAVRTSHNPPSEEFLNACDRIGLLVIDESFDGWREAKTPHDYSTLFDRWWTSDLESMVLRDRNHPSVFCWSIGNEIIERKKPEAVLTAYAMAGYVHRLDPTRPVTSALAAWDKDWEIYDPLAAAHDIVGYNYMMHKGPSDHERVPSRVMMQTESYPRDAFANWARVADHPYIIGDFVWTGIDYLGESGIGRFFYKGQTEGEHYHRDQYPWHGAWCGDIDLTGLRKPISHYRDLLHNPAREKLYMAVKEPDGYHGEISETQWSVWPTWESWNWPGHEGKDIDVEVYSRYPSVRLYLNDELIGEKPTTRTEEFKAVFTLPYRPGTLRVVGIENGQEAEQQTLETAGRPARLHLTVDRTEMTADGHSLAYVTVEVTDREGRTVPNAAPRLEFEVSGPGTLLATCSADLTDTTAYASAVRQAWKGRAMAVVKAGRSAGTITVSVKGKGLQKARTSIQTTANGE